MSFCNSSSSSGYLLFRLYKMKKNNRNKSYQLVRNNFEDEVNRTIQLRWACAALGLGCYVVSSHRRSHSA